MKYHTTINLQRRQSRILVSQVSFDTCFDELLVLWIKLVDLVSWVLVRGFTTQQSTSQGGVWDPGFPGFDWLLLCCWPVCVS
jgi:hypothetical protein